MNFSPENIFYRHVLCRARCPALWLSQVAGPDFEQADRRKTGLRNTRSCHWCNTQSGGGLTPKSRLEQGRKPRTITTELGTFSLVTTWALRQGAIKEIPRTKRIPVRRVDAVIPTAQEAVRIIQAMPERLRPLVRFPGQPEVGASTGAIGYEAHGL